MNTTTDEFPEDEDPMKKNEGQDSSYLNGDGYLTIGELGKESKEDFSEYYKFGPKNKSGDKFLERLIQSEDKLKKEPEDSCFIFDEEKSKESREKLRKLIEETSEIPKKDYKTERIYSTLLNQFKEKTGIVYQLAEGYPKKELKQGEIPSGLKKIFEDDHFDKIIEYNTGGTRKIYLAINTTTNHKEVFKVDIPSTSDKGTENAGKKELEIVKIVNNKITNRAKHHLSNVINYRELEKHGGKGILIREEFFGDGNLEEKINDGETLSCLEAGILFSHLISGINQLNNVAGIYHRDIKPSNVLIEGGGENLDSRITDYANGRTIKEVKEEGLKSNPTSGGRSFIDPLLYFTGKPAIYNQQSEMYSLASTVLFGMNGETTFYLDPLKENEQGIAYHSLTEDEIKEIKKLDKLKGKKRKRELTKIREKFKDRTLLNEKGLLNEELYEEKLRDSLESLPDKCKKYAGAIYRCMTSNLEERYTTKHNTPEQEKSIHEFKSHLEEIIEGKFQEAYKAHELKKEKEAQAKKKSPSKIRSFIKKIKPINLSIIAMMGVIGGYLYVENKFTEKVNELTEKKIYPSMILRSEHDPNYKEMCDSLESIGIKDEAVKLSFYLDPKKTGEAIKYIQEKGCEINWIPTDCSDGVGRRMIANNPHAYHAVDYKFNLADKVTPTNYHDTLIVDRFGKIDTIKGQENINNHFKKIKEERIQSRKKGYLNQIRELKKEDTQGYLTHDSVIKQNSQGYLSNNRGMKR